MTRILADLDDTFANTTRDLNNSWSDLHRLTLVEGALEFLRMYERRLILLSAGLERIQREKIRLLDIGKYFRHIIIAPGREGKIEHIRTFAATCVAPNSLVVIGDRLDHEIQIGNQYGCYTVRMRLPEGKYAALEPRSPLEEPNLTVSNFHELMARLPTTP